MDITNVSSALSALQFSDTSSLTQSVSMKMLDNALDMNATMSDGITRMMENSVYPVSYTHLTLPTTSRV